MASETGRVLLRHIAEVLLLSGMYCSAGSAVTFAIPSIASPALHMHTPLASSNQQQRQTTLLSMCFDRLRHRRRASRSLLPFSYFLAIELHPTQFVLSHQPGFVLALPACTAATRHVSLPQVSTVKWPASAWEHETGAPAARLTLPCDVLPPWHDAPIQTAYCASPTSSCRPETR